MKNTIQTLRAVGKGGCMDAIDADAVVNMRTMLSNGNFNNY